MRSSYKLGGVKEKDLHSFTKGMYYLLKGKIELTEALSIISENYRKEIKEKILKAGRKIESGNTLNKAFENITRNKEFLELIRIGEETGNLEYIFKSLYEKYEFKQKIRRDVRNLSVYPVTVIVTAIVITLVLLKLVVPRFTVIYSDINQELPGLTRAVVKLSSLLDRYGFFLLIVPIAVGYLFLIIKRSNWKIIERVLVKIVLIGKIYKEINILNFTQNMSFLVSSGVPLVRALKLSSSSRSIILNEEIRKITEKIEKGESFQKALQNSTFFNREYKSFLIIGEKTGGMADSFENLSQIYYEKISENIKIFLKFMEPISIIFIGSVIGIIIFSVMLPIFKMGEFL